MRFWNSAKKQEPTHHTKVFNAFMSIKRDLADIIFPGNIESSVPSLKQLKQVDIIISSLAKVYNLKLE